MFCPECGAEYRDEILECADCGVPLAAAPPEEPSHEAEPSVAVLRTGDAALLPVLRSLLSSAGIPFTIQGEESSGLFPFGSDDMVPDGRRFGAVLRVPESRAEEAKALIESAAPVSEGEEE